MASSSVAPSILADGMSAFSPRWSSDTASARNSPSESQRR